MTQTTLRELPRGSYFTLKDYGDYPDEKRVYIKQDYDRTSKKYSCIKFDDINAETFKKGATVVFTDFTF